MKVRIPPTRTVLAAISMVPCIVHANNIQVSNLSLTGNTGTTVQIQFDLSWENSWRGGGVINWDAAWVFVKYRTSITGAWQHVRLNNTGHAATGGQVDLGLLTPGAAYDSNTNPCIGVFIYRAAPGDGMVTYLGTQLRWNYSLLGIAYNDIAEIQVFAIEMVYVPQGAFASGSGGGEDLTQPLTTINTAVASTAPTGSGALGGQAGGHPTGVLNMGMYPSYPNGYSAFYCMKYEISQQGYVDFLNTLSYDGQVTRTASQPDGPAGTGAMISTNDFRNGIDIQTPGVATFTPAVYACNLNGNTVYGEPADGKELACNYLKWADFAAYLDWSGLRPMTEMEFEKACRGGLMPVAGEYPWGTTGIANNAYTLSNVGAANEAINANYSTTAGNASYMSTEGVIDGPVRVGIFAANGANSGRITAGAGYYGIMELGGNLWERCVHYGTDDGRSFQPYHGNGTLVSVAVPGTYSVGDPDVSSWPHPHPTIGAAGSGFRGGSWTSTVGALRTSDRTAATFQSVVRQSDFGGRGIRSAP